MSNPQTSDSPRSNETNNEENIVPEIPFIVPSTEPHPLSTPWISSPETLSPHPLVRLHNEMIIFHQYCLIGSEEGAQRSQAREDIGREILREFGSGEEEGQGGEGWIWGWGEEGLEMKGTELEIIILLQKEDKNFQQTVLQKCKQICENLSLNIFNFSTEINDYECRVICYNPDQKLEIHLSFISKEKSEVYKSFLQEVSNFNKKYSEFKYIYFVLDCLIRQRAWGNFIKNIMKFGLLAYFFSEKFKNDEVMTLSEAILKFLEFYASSPTLEKERKITYEGNSTFSCVSTNDRNFSFEIGEGVDISHRKVKDLFKVFNNRYRVLSNYYYPKGMSVLSHIVNPCLQEFFY